VTALLPDGQQCLICRAKAHHGRIVHQPMPYCIYPGNNPRGSQRAAGGVTGAAVADGMGPARYQLMVSRLEPTRRRDRYICPACGAGHDDPGKGLKVNPGPDGPLFICHDARRGGADYKTHGREILAALDLKWSDILPDRVQQWLDDILGPDQPVPKRSRT